MAGERMPEERWQAAISFFNRGMRIEAIIAEGERARSAESALAADNERLRALVDEAFDIIRANLPAFDVWINQAADVLGVSDCGHVNVGPPCDDCRAAMETKP